MPPKNTQAFLHYQTYIKLMIIPRYHQRHRSQSWKIITVPRYNTVTSLVAQMVKASAYNAETPGSVPGSGRFPGEGNGNTLQYSCLEKSSGWRSLVGYSPWGCKEPDTTERLHFLSHYSWNMFSQSTCLNRGPHQAHLHLVVMPLEYL